jgi:hypothetical protein
MIIRTKITFLLILVILFSCKESSVKESVTSSEEPKPIESKETNKLDKDTLTAGQPEINAKFVINSKDDGGTGNPTSDVSVSLNNKIVFLKGITGYVSDITAAEYKNKEIPKDAISACGGWWAGAGTYFYIVKSKKGIEVFEGWQEEGQTDVGFHWELFKKIDL